MPVITAWFSALFSALRSRRLTTSIMLIWLGLLLMWIVPFQIYGLPAEQIRNIIYREAFFAWVYAALATITIACLWVRTLDAWRKSRRTPSIEARLRIGGTPVEVPGKWDSSQAMRALSRAGFSRRVEGDGWVWGVRNPWSSIGTVLSHAALALIILVTAWWLYQPVAFEGSAIVAEGERFNGAIESYVETSGAGVPDVAFELKSVSPVFYEDILLFTQLDCAILDDAGRRRTVRVGTPWYPDPTTQVALEDFGWTAQVLGGRDATTVVGPDVYKLQAFPPGSPDYIDLTLEDARYRLKVVIYGDFAERDGEPGVASYNLKNPRVGVTAWRVLSSDVPLLLIRDHIAAPGEEIELSDRDSIVFLDIGTYGKFRISRVFPIQLALALAALLFTGFAMRLALPRTEALLSPAKEGHVELRVRAEVYGASPYTQLLLDSWRDGEEGR